MKDREIRPTSIDLRSQQSANVDANYGPWTSIGEETSPGVYTSGSYMEWLKTITPLGTPVPKEGTIIAIQPNANADVELKVYSKGSWNPVGSGKVDYTEAEAGNYEPLKNYVGYVDQGITDENKKQAARNNIGAVSSTQVTNAISNKVDKSDWLFTYNGTQVGYHGGINSDGGGSGGGSPVMPDGALNPTSSNSVQNQVITAALGSKLSKDYGSGGTETVHSNVTFESETGTSTETVIANTFKFTKKNTGAAGVTAGFLTRNTSGVVSSQTLTATDVEYTEEEGYETTILTPGNTVDWCLSALDNAITETNERIDGIEVTTPGTLNTDNSSAQTVNESESLGGTVKLHKVSKTGAYADLIGKPNVSTSNDTTTISGDAYVSGGTVLGSSANPSTPKNVTINNGTNGSTTVNGTLTVAGDVNLGTGNTSTAKTITIGSSGTNNPADDVVVNGNVTISNNLTLGKTGNKGGLLRTDSNGAVSADTGIFMKYTGEVDTYDNLPDSEVSVGDVKYVKDTGKLSVCVSVSPDSNLYVSFISTSNGKRKVYAVHTGTDQPPIGENNFIALLQGNNTNDFDGYPQISTSDYSTFYPAIAGYGLRIVPVETNGGDLVIVLVEEAKDYATGGVKHAYVASKMYSTGGAENTWYLDGRLEGGNEVIALDLSDNTLPPDNPSDPYQQKQTFRYFDGVMWTK